MLLTTVLQNFTGLNTHWVLSDISTLSGKKTGINSVTQVKSRILKKVNFTLLPQTEYVMLTKSNEKSLLKWYWLSAECYH